MFKPSWGKLVHVDLHAENLFTASSFGSDQREWHAQAGRG